MSTPDSPAPFHLSAGPRDGDRHSFSCRLPADLAYFEGHFPGHPVLPAVAQLELLRQAMHSIEPGLALRAVDGLRLSQPLVPGDRVELEVQVPEDDEGTAFVVRRDGSTVTQGRVRWSRP
ncbi:MAG: hypothetical protein AAF481_01280 [Acidobacteriota bacterium]